MATDRELLIRIDKKVAKIETNQNWLMNGFANHLKHHFMVTLCSISSAAVAVTALIIFILRSK